MFHSLDWHMAIYVYGIVSINLCHGRNLWKTCQTVRNSKGLNNLKFTIRTTKCFRGVCFLGLSENDLGNRPDLIYTSMTFSYTACF